MASSMITGEQRWASKRRSGMTVLGKVAKAAVPKPLNLPSQRLENHGLDPNVKIVPKGTLSWGSKPSSAWSTSALPPSTDDGSSSPSHLAGRPLSGSGTSPSTAGSEKAHDSYVTSWGPNSRPSSATGVMGSKHASLTSLRPHSAETRPGSSQLLRVGEPSAEGSGPWHATPSSKRMGVAEGFSLSSGDFPTLGSEKDVSGRDAEPIDASHGRSGSSSGGVKSLSDNMEITHDNGRGTDNKDHSWRKDCLPFAEDGPRPSMERWHGDPHLYPNPNIGPPHFDSWRGPPPGGAWHRGPPGPPPYGGPIPPGGFHMDPFPYYHPHGPAPGAGHHGRHPTNGDMYRPHLPESFMRPGVPMRPGFYPPPVPYEGYYRPPMGYGNPNEQDFPFMGMPSGPPIYNRPINQNAPDLNSSQPRSGEGRGPDRHNHGLLQNPRGNRNDGWNQNDEGKWVHRVDTDRLNHEKGILSKPTYPSNAWGDNVGETAAEHEMLRAHGSRFHSSRPANSMLSGSVSNVQESDTGLAGENLASSKDHSLIQKIEGLNAKARTSVLDKHYPAGELVRVSCDTNVARDKCGEPILTHVPRRVIHGAQNRGNHHGKANFDGQEASGWGRQSTHLVQSDCSNLSTNEQLEDHNSAMHPSEVLKANFEMKSGEESAVPGFDRSDTQRAKMRAIAKQRAIQLQKEEEERIREQKAKALAKLEELNKRSASQGAEVPNQTETVAPHSTCLLNPDSSRDQPDTKENSNAETSSVIPINIAQINVNGGGKVEDSAAGNIVVPQVHDIPKNKQTGYKPRQDVPPEKNLTQISIVVGQIDVLIDHRKEYANEEVDVDSKVDGGSMKELPTTPFVSDTRVRHKRKNNKSGKNKHKVERSSYAAVSSTVSPDNSDPVQADSVSREDLHGRPNNFRKAQHSNKPRSSQGNRLAEKGQNNDATVWAPVRSHNKVSNSDRTSQNVAEPVVSSAMGGSMPQGVSKAKRAKLERYVPKPVAKELAQGSTQQSRPLSADQSLTAQAVKDSVTGGREQTSKGSDSVEKTSKNIQPSTESSMKGGSEASVSDGWNTVNDSSSKSSSATFTGAKDQLLSGKGKSHPFKGKKGSGNSQSFNHRISDADEINHTEKTISSKENRAGVDRSKPHWQPKSQVYVSHNQQGNRSHGDHTHNHISQDNKVLKPAVGSGSGVHSHSQSQYNQYEDKGKGKDTDTQDIGYQESKRENKSPQVKGHPHPPKYSNYGGRVNSERQRQNSHYEYQPVGPYNNDSGFRMKNQHGGPKFRRRGGHSRRGRGNFQGWQNGTE